MPKQTPTAEKITFDSPVLGVRLVSVVEELVKYHGETFRFAEAARSASPAFLLGQDSRIAHKQVLVAPSDASLTISTREFYFELVIVSYDWAASSAYVVDEGELASDASRYRTAFARELKRALQRW